MMHMTCLFLKCQSIHHCSDSFALTCKSTVLASEHLFLTRQDTWKHLVLISSSPWNFHKNGYSYACFFFPQPMLVLLTEWFSILCKNHGPFSIFFLIALLLFLLILLIHSLHEYPVKITFPFNKTLCQLQCHARYDFCLPLGCSLVGGGEGD